MNVVSILGGKGNGKKIERKMERKLNGGREGMETKLKEWFKWNLQRKMRQQWKGKLKEWEK